MQIPVLKGIYADESANIYESYPVNMVPMPMQSGISSGYLRVADGARSLGPGAGPPRGGIAWNGECYRVSGTKLVKVNADGTHTVLGDVGPGGRITMTYSFDRLAVAAGGHLFYYNGSAFSEVTDPALGTVLAVIWVDGYFMTTDGEFLVVTDLADPTTVNPLKYGSSEIDPDPIVTVLRLRTEVVAVNRYTLEFFTNSGGSGFPFDRVNGAQIQKGALGQSCACVFSDAVAFLGGGKNETPAIYLGLNGETTKLSTAGIDSLLNRYKESELSAAVLETHMHRSHPQLWIRLNDRTLVYDMDASKATGESVWFQLTSAKIGFKSYRIIDPVWCHDMWMVCDAQTGDFGIITEDSAHHFDETVRWEFSTVAVYNEGRGALWNSLELVCLPGRVAEDDSPVISTSYTLDGETWSEDRVITAGAIGDRAKRLAWFRQGRMNSWRVQRFRGDSKARLSVVRLEVALEPLNV
jgi:hypothetical protein